MLYCINIIFVITKYKALSSGTSLSNFRNLHLIMKDFYLFNKKKNLNVDSSLLSDRVIFQMTRRPGDQGYREEPLVWAIFRTSVLIGQIILNMSLIPSLQCVFLNGLVAGLTLMVIVRWPGQSGSIGKVVGQNTDNCDITLIAYPSLTYR